ncbi:MAG TPA: DciA family protein [Nocardioides sp.]|nr:DciA family protein [Nocardioides sp.]
MPEPEDDTPEVPAEPGEPEHRADGLDLARSITQGTAGAGTTPARRRFPRSSEGRPAGGRVGNRGRFGGPQLSGARPDGRDPQGLGSEVDKLVDTRGWALDLQVRGVFGRWTEIVGEEIGAHSTPESLTDGTLVVRTDSTAWATQLKLFAGTLVQRLNAELGDGTVTLVEVLGPHGPSWKYGRRGVRDGRGPRDTYG